MAGENFKERVRLSIIQASKDYKKVYMDYEYLICSNAFVRKEFYILSAEKDNFQHLTGVHSNINAKDFFDKSYNGTLSINDFDFVKRGQNEKSVKGTVRRKIKILPNIMNLFRSGLQAEENFIKNKILCSFAMADGNCTLGFVEADKSRPKTLIKGNALKTPAFVDLILRKENSSIVITEITNPHANLWQHHKLKFGFVIASGGRCANLVTTICFETYCRNRRMTSPCYFAPDMAFLHFSHIPTC